ncbi:phosphatase PAP2 family protein [Streptomyces candidus]|uniref:Membrane-associated phospholipid phosphatase n=1 Tax=Streptomyces candidus TaxID=67283 RepID=A0A7X0HF81_9ACTN|nr:phosphatase PAP2 family protein [Streptomyces candidus]MBB6436535.1 membrane-associated phospholipid phosphatase [Streptomyces candidus]GHH49313.1 membrane protein [Streptomyces candidus]
MRIDRIFARLDREPEPPKIEIPRMSGTRKVLFGSTLAFYLAIVWAVLLSSWLVLLDWKVMLFRAYEQWPELHAFLDYLVVLGQRGPTAVMVAAWLGWRSWRQHTLRPLLTLATSLLLLNVTVGAVKIGLGRLGPHYATQIGSAELYAGGDIFPSGHTANAVVTWGILAYLATTPRARRWLSVLSAVVALSVGATTVYLGTHWLSDVLLGWAAGLLILLALPWFEPLIGRAEAFVFAVRERWRSRGAFVPAVPGFSGGVPGAAVPAGAAVTVPAVLPGATEPAAAREPVSAGGSRYAGTRPASQGVPAHLQASAHLQARPHAARSERPSVAPAGSRRPPQPHKGGTHAPHATR